MDNKVKRGISGREVLIGGELGDNSKFIVVNKNFEGNGIGGHIEDYDDDVAFCGDKEELFNFLLWCKFPYYVDKLEEEGKEVEDLDYDVLVNKSMEEKRELLIKVMNEVGEVRDDEYDELLDKTYIIEFK